MSWTGPSNLSWWHGGYGRLFASLYATNHPDNTTTALDDNQQEDASLLVPFLDVQSPFVQMSRLGWSVNRLVWQSMLCLASQSLAAFAAPPSLLWQNHVDTTLVHTPRLDMAPIYPSVESTRDDYDYYSSNSTLVKYPCRPKCNEGVQ